MKNWLILDQRNSASQRIPSFSKKQVPSFYQKSLNKRSIYIQLPHTLNNNFRRWFPETELTSILNQPNYTLDQHLKYNFMRSKLISWKPSTTLKWKYQLSHQTNPLNLMNYHILSQKMFTPNTTWKNFRCITIHQIFSLPEPWRQQYNSN